VRITLYHNAMSTCSQKVRLALESKRTSWISQEIDLVSREHKSEEYLQINSSGVVPTLKVDDVIITESSVINEFVEEACDGPSLLPADPIGRANARLWVKRLDDGVHAACGVMTYATVMRAVMMSMPLEAIEEELKAISDPYVRMVRSSLFDYGTEAPYFSNACETLFKYVRDLDLALSEQPWVAGQTFSIADCGALPYVIRLQHMGLASLWEGGRLPGVEKWFAAAQCLPAYQAAVEKWINPQVLAMFEHTTRGLSEKVKLD
jgi:ganglioside-induced differentiation-associated protein 1